MDSGLFTLFLPIALAIMMTGLGLELTLKDFLRIQYYPKAIFLALFAQLIILVFIAFLICIFLQPTTPFSCGLNATCSLTRRTYCKFNQLHL